METYVYDGNVYSIRNHVRLPVKTNIYRHKFRILDVNIVSYFFKLVQKSHDREGQHKPTRSGVDRFEKTKTIIQLALLKVS